MKNMLVMMSVLVAYCLITSVAQAQAGPRQTFEIVEAYLQQHRQPIFDQLVDYLSIPNSANSPQQIHANLAYLETALRRRGARVEVLGEAGAPVLYAEVNNSSDRTLVIYTHLDGQSTTAGNWITPPFQPSLRQLPFDNLDTVVSHSSITSDYDPELRLFARSAGDDKGPMVAVLAALDALDALDISPKINLKFFVETEEEQGSPHLAAVLERYAHCYDDGGAWLFADGPVHESGQHQVILGVRGVVAAEMTVYGANRPLHSGHYGNFVPNPAARMARLLASMRSDTGTVLIDGVNRPDPFAGVEYEEPLAYRDQLRELGIAESEQPRTSRDRAVLASAVNIVGLRAGEVAEKTRNAIPVSANAALDFRLAPGLDPRDLKLAVEKHIRGFGYHLLRRPPSDDERALHPRIVSVVWKPGGYAAAYTSASDPFARALRGIAEASLGGVRLVHMAGGSLPLAHFSDALGQPFAILPISNHDNNQHAPNENIRMGHFYDGIALYATVIAHIAPALQTRETQSKESTCLSS